MLRSPIDPGMAAGEVLRRYPAALEVFDRHGVVFCAGCFLTLFDPLEDVAGYHAVHDVAALLDDLNRVAARPAGERPVWALGSAPASPSRPEAGGDGDPVAAALGIRLIEAGGGSARASLSLSGGEGSDPAVAAALALFAARAADRSLGRERPAVLDLRLEPQAAQAAPAAPAAGSDRTLLAEARPERDGSDGPARAYRVRILGDADSAVGVATVVLR